MKSPVLFSVILCVASCSVVPMALAEGTPVDPMAAYRYQAPANSWYAAKIKPKFAVRAKVRENQPDATAAKPPVDSVNAPAEHRIDASQALPFWHEIPATK